MARPHIASVIEDLVFTRVERVLRRRGWHERVTGYTGYGTQDSARLLARVLLSRKVPREAGTLDDDAPGAVGHTAVEQAADAIQSAVWGWRNFITAPALNAPVTVTLGQVHREVQVDRGGYLDLDVSGHGLEPGWHEAVIRAANGDTVHAPVWIMDPSAQVGLVSDIDDTVMVTHLPRLLIAMRNTFFLDELARKAVAGMAPLLRSLVNEHPKMPVFYLSTGAWNTAPTLRRFLRRYGYPDGPLLLTDWGPTHYGWFRSGQKHKSDELHRLLRDFPGVRWILVGDDGQHDPDIYGEFARQHPEAVEVVLIRQLTTREQVLSHGLPIANDELLGKDYAGVPMLRGPDGFALHQFLAWSRAEFARLRPAARRRPGGPGAGSAEPSVGDAGAGRPREGSNHA